MDLLGTFKTEIADSYLHIKYIETKQLPELNEDIIKLKELDEQALSILNKINGKARSILENELPDNFTLDKFFLIRNYPYRFQAEYFVKGLVIEGLDRYKPQLKKEEVPLSPLEKLASRHDLKLLLNTNVLTKEEKRSILGLINEGENE